MLKNTKIIIRKFLITALCFVPFFYGNITFGQSVGGTDVPNRADTQNRADNNIRSVARINPSTLAMEFSIPLGNYPGRNGNSIPITIDYSSKLWEIEPSFLWFYVPSPLSGNRKYVTDNNLLYGKLTAAGWTSSMTPPRLDTKLQLYNQYGKAYDPEFDFTGIVNLYQEMEDSILNGGQIDNIASPFICGLSCAFSTSVCILDANGDPVDCETECWNWTYRYCVYDPPTGPQPPIEAPETIQMHYVKRIRIQMPDGATHEFRKSDSVFGFCQPNHPNNGSCDQNGEDTNGDFLAVDGSGMRLTRSTTESVLYMPNGDRYIFPPLSNYNGEQWFATEFISVDGNRLKFDQTQSINSNGVSEVVAGWKDTVGRNIEVPLPMNWIEQTQQVGDKQYELPGLTNGSNQNFTFRWKKLKGSTAAESALDDPDQQLSYGSSRLCWGNTSTTLPREGETYGFLFGGAGLGTRLCNGFYFDENEELHPALFNPTVLSEVILPNGKDYKFGYNEFGEITRIKFPDGSYEKFVYDWVVPISGSNNNFYDQTNRGVKERFVYDVNDVLQQRWQYEEEINGRNYPLPDNAFYRITTIAPKADDPMSNGIRSERYLTRTNSPPPSSQYGNYGFQDPRTGVPYEERTYDENNNLRNRSLTEWIVAPPRVGGETYAVRDARPVKKILINIENGKALASMSESEYETPGENGSSAPTDPTYFAHLNVKRSKSHHFRHIPLSLAQTGTIAQISAYFNSSTVATISETDYLYDSNYKDRGISSLPIESRTIDPTTNAVLAKTQTVYDNQTPAASTNYPSGYTTQNYGITNDYDCDMEAPNKCWIDPATPFLGRPTTSRVWDSDNNIWIESHTRYDIFGNVIAARDPIGNEITTLFEDSVSKPYKYAYPTQVTASAPDPTNIHGTNEGTTVSTTYDFMTGLPLTVTDQFGQTTATEYDDPLLRPTRAYAVNFTAPETQTIYDDVNLTLTVKKQIDLNTWDEATTYSDSLGRTIKTRAKDSQGDVFVETHYDLLGRVDRVSNPYRVGDTVLWSKTRYDEMGRAVESYAPTELANLANAESLGTTSFDISSVGGYLGTAVKTNDASGRQGRSITNALGQLIVVEEPGFDGNVNPLPTPTPDPSPSPGGPVNPPPPCFSPFPECPENLVAGEYPSYATYYKYNATGQMVEVTQGEQKRWFKYDSLGRLIRVRQPEQEVNTALNLSDPYNTSGQWTAGFTYDVMGNVLTATDANGVTITNTYDKAGRVKTRSYSDGTTPSVSFYYDGKGLASTQSPNFAKGKLTKVTSSVSETQYQLFDNLGRMTQMAQITDGETYTSKYTYNFAGALIEEEYPSGRKVKNEFETDGDLMKVSSQKNGSSPFAPYVSNFSYTASGGISQMRLGNGRWETAKFNDRQQVTELGLGNSAADASVWKTNYAYGEIDSNGDVDTTKNTGNIARQTLTVPGTSFVQSYKYDSLYRITEAKETTGANQNWIQNWSYDRYGNRTGFTQNIAGLIAAPNPTIDANTNRFNGSQGFAYDKNGNIINDVDPLSSLTRQFIFNGDNKQTEVKKDGITIGRYYYDGEGKRVKKVTDTETTVFVYSSGKLIAEYSTQLSTTPSVAYTTTDHLGTPRIITDELGQVKARRDFMPFGEELYMNIGGRTGDAGLKYSSSEDDVRQKFTGYEKDNESDLNYAKARYQNPNLGRFNSPDPVRMLKARMADPQHWNLYVYARNNPILMVDSNGEFPWTFHIRSFIYSSTVGGGLFRGDGRTPSLETNNPSITSRVRASFTLDYASGRITNKNVQSDSTLFYGAGPNVPPLARTGTPGMNVSNVETFGYTKSKGVSVHYWGKDPITPGIVTPDLDVHANISINESYNKDKTGKLSISGTFTGDTFPSTEAFVVDQSGKTKVFLGAKLEEGGVGDLYGDNKTHLFNVDLQIKFDKKGNFTAVIENGKTYSVEAWNKRVQAEF